MRASVFLFSLLAVLSFMAPVTTVAADEATSKQASDLRMQLAKADEQVKTMADHLRLANKFSSILTSNHDFLSKSTLSIHRLADSFAGISQRKRLDTLIAESPKITDLTTRLKVISDIAAPFTTKDTPEGLRKALILVLERTEKVAEQVRIIATLTNMTPDQVVEKMRKDGRLPPLLEMTPPKTLDKSTQTMSQAELDVLIAQKKVIKVNDLQNLLKPDEREITSGQAKYIRDAYQSLSNEAHLLADRLGDAHRALAADIAAANNILQHANAKMMLLKISLAQYPPADTHANPASTDPAPSANK